MPGRGTKCAFEVVMFWALLFGLLLGFLGSMPIAGPTAAVVISKGLDNEGHAGLCVGVGSAIAEAIYAFVAFWGLAALLSRLPHLVAVSRLVACSILAALGVYFVTRRRRSASPALASRPPTSPRSALLGFTMTAVNPTLLLSWSAAIGIAHSTGLLRVDASNAFPFAVGVGVGIASWYALLGWLLARFRKRVTPVVLRRVTCGMGVFLILLGVGFGVRVLTAGL